jgi:hypothetical protein
MLYYLLSLSPQGRTSQGKYFQFHESRPAIWLMSSQSAFSRKTPKFPSAEPSSRLKRQNSKNSLCEMQFFYSVTHRTHTRRFSSQSTEQTTKNQINRNMFKRLTLFPIPTSQIITSPSTSRLCQLRMPYLFREASSRPS